MFCNTLLAGAVEGVADGVDFLPHWAVERFEGHAEEEDGVGRGVIPCWQLRIRWMLRDEEHSRLSLTKLSGCVGRHPVQISRQFHHYFGCTVSEYVRRVRIGRAQSLLCCREMEMAEIALACGFADQSHFTTAFREVTGVTPGRYRRGM